MGRDGQNGSGGNGEPVQAEALRTLAQDIGDEELERLLDLFRSSLEGYRTQLRTGVETEDLNGTKKIACGLKGLCMQFGATHSWELARMIELDVSSVAEARDVLARLCAEIDRVERFISSWEG